MLRRRSLGAQLLAGQLVLVLAVVIPVAFVSYAQSLSSFRREQQRRVLSVAEAVAGNGVLRSQLMSAPPRPLVATVAENARSVSGVDDVAVVQPDLRIITSADPSRVGTPMDFPDDYSVISGRQWVGLVDFRGRVAVTAFVPVFDDRDTGERSVVGVVVAQKREPSFIETLRGDTPGLLVYVGVASALGVVGSLLLARRVKRQTLGMEPRAIARLVEHRDAMLQGVKEGVIGLDREERVTLVNDEARNLLGLPDDVVGRPVSSLGLPPPVVDSLTAQVQGHDEVVILGERMLILNRRPIVSKGRELGSVTTLRDRTELVTLQTELDTTRATTDTLRAQAHEFDNRLHTIAGLAQLGEFDEVVSYVHGIRVTRDRISAELQALIEDPAIAALLLAKSSVATEQQVSLRVSPRTKLGRVTAELESDLVTVIGNLVDNALESASGHPDACVEVEITDLQTAVVVVVRDSGPGVAAELVEEIFVRGFSTKAGTGRGLGLALIQLVCSRRGGAVEVRDDAGAVFTASLPKTPDGRRQ